MGIYKQGSRKKPTPLFHHEQSEKEIYQLVSQLKYKSHYYASLRNFKNSLIMNFTAKDFARGLYFSTWTFNNSQTQLKFSFTSGTSQGKRCVFAECEKEHYYQTVPVQTSSFLAEKRIASKQLSRSSKGVNDLFANTIRLIAEHLKPDNFKWVMVPELHKCQTPCHWKGKKSKQKGWKNHSENNCSHSEKHQCLRNWHFHMLSTDFLPTRFAHSKCGLGKYDYQGSPLGCWDHRAFIAHELWPYGLVDMKRVSHLKVQGQPIKSAEQVLRYLSKYLAKSFQMRENKLLAEKVGLLKGMSVYKFFRVIYGYKNGLPFVIAKRQKPLISSSVFINNDYGFTSEVEREFAPYFTPQLKLVKKARQLLRKKEPQLANHGTLTNLLKLCLLHSTRSKIKQNHFWKPCDTSEDPTWVKGSGWQVSCPLRLDHHTEPLIRWEFEFSGVKSYQAFKTIIGPALSTLSWVPFAKYQEWQISQSDYQKFARESSYPWNRHLGEHEPLWEIGESWESKEWQASISPELVYNAVYLKEIRAQIRDYVPDFQLGTDEARKRYADY